MHQSTCKQYQTYVVGIDLWYLTPLLAISDYNYPFGISKLFLQRKMITKCQHEQYVVMCSISYNINKKCVQYYHTCIYIYIYTSEN